MVPPVTLFLPTFNPGPGFPELLDRLQRQRLDRPFEVLVIDSGSTDGTVELLRQRQVRLIEIPKAEFNHGRIRARAVKESHGEIIVLTVQDALPADEYWMQWLVNAFDDKAVAGAYSRHIARQQAGPFVRDRIQHGGGDSPRIQALTDPAEFQTLTPIERARLSTFDNVSAAVRRRTAVTIPFMECRFGEDLDWARRALLAGYKIVYEPRSIIIHSHNRSPWYEFKRMYLDHQLRCRLFGLRTVPNRRAVLASSAGAAMRAARVVGRDPSLRFGERVTWWMRALPYAVGQSVAQYLGARSVTLIPRSAFYRWIDTILGRQV